MAKTLFLRIPHIRMSCVFIALVFVMFSSNAYSQGAKQPFRWSISADGKTLNVIASVPENHHLYSHMTKIVLKTADDTTVEPEIKPPSIDYEDKLLGKINIFRGKSDFIWKFPLEKVKFPATLSVGWQGCREEGAGENAICYMPGKVSYKILSAEPLKDTIYPAAQKPDADEKTIGAVSKLPAFKIERTASGYIPSGEFTAFLKGESGESVFSFAGKSFGAVILLTMLGGILLNLTPCVLPMIPINLAIIGAGTGEKNKARSLIRGLVYAAGIALAYGVTGLFVVLGGKSVGQINSEWWFNGIVAVIFIALSLAMFGVFNVDFSRYESHFKVRNSAETAGVFIMGVIAALLAGACVAPVVVAVMLQSAKMYAEGNTAGLMLPFALGVGMAIPWPLAASGISVLPKPGKWMNYIKYAFGVMIMLIGLYYAYLSYESLMTKGGIYTASQKPPHEILAEAFAESEKTGKPVFIDFWATWCKNCSAMNLTTFKNAAVKTELEKFIDVRLQAEDFSDPATAGILKAFKVTGLPTYVIAVPEK